MIKRFLRGVAAAGQPWIEFETEAGIERISMTVDALTEMPILALQVQDTLGPGLISFQIENVHVGDDRISDDLLLSVSLPGHKRPLLLQLPDASALDVLEGDIAAIRKRRKLRPHPTRN